MRRVGLETILQELFAQLTIEQIGSNMEKALYFNVKRIGLEITDIEFNKILSNFFAKETIFYFMNHMLVQLYYFENVVHNINKRGPFLYIYVNTFPIIHEKIVKSRMFNYFILTEILNILEKAEFIEQILGINKKRFR